MENNDQQLILGLAERLRQAQPVRKDPQPAELIARHIASQPDAVYLLTQAVLLQEDALRTAQAQIAELSGAQSQSGGGFLSGMFGRNQAPATPAPAPAPSGGGFLKTAAAAAVGVAGGALLMQGLSSAFEGDHQTNAQAGWDEESEQW